MYVCAPNITSGRYVFTTATRAIAERRHTPQSTLVPRTSKLRHTTETSRLRSSKHQTVAHFAAQNQHPSSLHTESPADKPAVVLIGWLGAKERHFVKYVELWQQLGYQTFGFRPSTPSVLFPPIGSNRAASFITDVQLFQKSQSHTKLIYHIFSNAGFLFFGTVLRAIAAADAENVHSLPHNTQSSLQQSMLQPLQGIIFDSAPCHLTPDISARGFTAAVLSKPAATITSQHPRLVAAAQAAFTPVLKLPMIANRQNQIWQAWDTVAPTSPQLYLYSSADALIPPEEVQRFQKLQTARGVDVHSKMWSDSAHCEHYRVHPDEYITELKKFAQAIMC